MLRSSERIVKETVSRPVENIHAGASRDSRCNVQARNERLHSAMREHTEQPVRTRVLYAGRRRAIIAICMREDASY